MKDAEFEQSRKALQIIRKETTNRNERQRRSILPRCKQLHKTLKNLPNLGSKRRPLANTNLTH